MINKGDKAIIVGSAEEEKYKGCVFEVLSEPYTVCGSTVVKMKCDETGKYFGGGYDVEFLRKVNEDERRNERDRLIELLHEAFIISDDNYGMPNTKQVADYLMRNGAVVMPLTIGQLIDTIFSHNSRVCITVEDESDRHYSKSIFNGMGWEIPDTIKDLKCKRIYACVPENISDSDILHIEAQKGGVE